ncbi:hypothetical protein [Paracoccus aestuarii]|uniref:hypothetical protein n=1 Tax=Paracoccus aestuarii TaxID=453842 RepID=UPI0011C3B240|nr:hypothetical protein [Paracoccus aestuarii]WCQ99566.1 hypothetical protein JHW48_02120 [Paracoccus aestuarii]
MSPAVQRYEVSQIFAEARARGLPMQLACVAALRWFEVNQIAPPVSILDWLGAVPTAQWRPTRVH